MPKKTAPQNTGLFNKMLGSIAKGVGTATSSHPVDSLLGFVSPDLLAMKQDSEKAGNAYPVADRWNGPGDAMRHLMFSSKLADRYGQIPSQLESLAHEYLLNFNESSAEREMDLYNDTLGRSIAGQTSDPAEMQRLAQKYVDEGTAKTIKGKEGAPSNYAAGGLAELANKYEGGPCYQFKHDDHDEHFNFAGGGAVAKAMREWLKGHPEKSLEKLKMTAGGDDPAQLLKAMEEGTDPNPSAYMLEQMPSIKAKGAINNWIDTTLKNYVRRDYGQEWDPLAQLTPEQRHVPLMDEQYRAQQSNAVWPPRNTINKSNPAGISTVTRAQLENPQLMAQRPGHLESIYEENPWMLNKGMDEPISSFDHSNLGFEHLIKELHNASRPDSDLPDQLRVRPESLSRMSMSQASQLAGKINEHRDMLREAERQKMLLTPYKEYKSGHKWVELPGASDPQGLKAVMDTGCEGGWCTMGEEEAKSYSQPFSGRKLYALLDPENKPHAQAYTVDNDFGPRIQEIKPRGNKWDSQYVQDAMAKNPQYKEELMPYVQDFVKSGKWSRVGDIENTDLLHRGDLQYHIEDNKVLPGVAPEVGLAALDRAKAANALPEYMTHPEATEALSKFLPSPEEQAQISADLVHLFKKNNPGMAKGGAAADLKGMEARGDYYDQDQRSKTGIEMLDSALDPFYAVKAGLDAQILPSTARYKDAAGSEHSYTAPGIVQSLIGMGALPSVFGGPEIPMSTAAGTAYNEGLARTLAHYGLPDEEHMTRNQHVGKTLGELLGQIPLGAEKLAVEGLPIAKKVLMAIPEYLGPTIHPSAANYAFGTAGGEAFPHVLRALQEMDEKYPGADLQGMLDQLQSPTSRINHMTDPGIRELISKHRAESHGYAGGGAVIKAAERAAERAAEKGANKIIINGSEVKVTSPSDNIVNVRDANFQYPKTIGNQTVDINSVSGGVRLDEQEKNRIAQLANKISSPEGYFSRIIVDQNNSVIEGQHRLEALRQLGAKEVPVYKIEELADTMPVDKMKDAINSVGNIHPDHVNQLIQHALNGIAENGMEGAKDLDLGYFQKHYDAALNAIPANTPQSSLDMGHEARMARAAEQGFDINNKLYHGTTDDFKSFDLNRSGKNDSGWYGKGVYLTPDTDTASAYTQYQERDSAGRTGVPGANVMPVYTKLKNPYYWPENKKAALTKEESQQIRDDLMQQGYDGVIVSNKYGDPKWAHNYETVVFNPSDIRSKFAAFDPEKVDSSDLGHAKGGLAELVQKYSGGGAAVKAAAEAAAEAAARAAERAPSKVPLNTILPSAEDVPENLYGAADRAAAGRKAAELIKSQELIKASEALGQAMEQGFTKTSTTQADRTRVGGGGIGGGAFSALSEADPEYAGKVWGVTDPGTASRLTNLTTPETAWTTMLGSATQLKTNPVVFDKLQRAFVKSMKEGNLSPELADKINQNLALTFGEGADIRDPSIWNQADTFEKRAALADVMLGEGVTPKKGGIALGGEKSGKGVIFKPTDILMRETEPGLLHPEHGGNVPTFALGPRLFSMNTDVQYRPDLHPGFPTLIGGKDLGVNMIPTPSEIYLRDWYKRFKQVKPNRNVGRLDLTLGLKGEGLPSQDLNDDYIRHLIREGFSHGGSVEFQNLYNKYIG